jgi:hypothetical protein
VGRLACGIAPWLESNEPGEAELRETLTRDVADSISSLMDPDSPDSCPMEYDLQMLVDMAFVAQALLRSPRVLRVHYRKKRRFGLLKPCRTCVDITFPDITIGFCSPPVVNNLTWGKGISVPSVVT